MTIFMARTEYFRGSRLFSKTIEEMLSDGRNSGNNRNEHYGHYTRKMRTSGGDAEIKVPAARSK